MKIAVVEGDSRVLSLYRDALAQYDADYFDSYNKFLQVGNGLYGVIVLSHRIGGYDWLSVYNRLENVPRVIVTATFPAEYYKTNEALNIYNRVMEVNSHPNCIFHLKDDFKNILRSIEIEELYNLPSCPLVQ